MKNRPFKKLRLAWLAFALMLLGSAASAVAIPDVLAGPIVNSANNHVYYLLKENTWSNAEAIAVNLGGHLATINDAAENTWVYNTFSAYDGTSREVWIGLNDAAQEGTFVWASGEPVVYTSWYAGEPSNSGPGGTEDFAYIYPPSQGGYATFWNDVDNQYTGIGNIGIRGVVEVPASKDGATNVVCTPPASGLIAWWRAEGNAYNTVPTVGGNDGVLKNGTSFTAGKVGQAFSFDGAGQYVKIPFTTSLNVANQLTVEFWMKADPSNPMQTYQGLVDVGYYTIEISNGYGGRMGVNWALRTGSSSSPSVHIADNNGGGIPVSGGVWHHIAGTYNGAQLQLYIDGVPAGNPMPVTGNVVPMWPNDFAAIGSSDGRTWCACGNRYFKGLVDEPAIYNRALTASEIQAIYNVGSAGKCVPPPVPPIEPEVLAGPIVNPANGHSYYLLNSNSWTASEAIAVKLGGHLTTINDAAENTWIYNIFSIYGGTSHEVWIGLNDAAQEGTFVWVSGELVTYTNWYPIEPSNGGLGGTEDFAYIYPPSQGGHATFWNDVDNQYTGIGNVGIRGVVEVPAPADDVTNTVCTPPASSLIAWWRADGNANDTIGGNNGVAGSGASFVAGKVGQAFSFDGGSNSYVEVSDSPALQLTNALTIECWVKRLNISQVHILLGKGGDWVGGQANYQLALNDTSYPGLFTPHFGFGFAGGWRGCDVIPDTKWHHYAVVAQNGDVNPVFYIDGVVQPVTQGGGSSTIILNPTLKPLLIGAQIDPLADYFSQTMIDEVAIYNSALSSTEIQAIYNASSAGKCVPPPVPASTPTPTLTVLVNGGGKVSPPPENLNLKLGKSYVLTAVPFPRNIFSNWIYMADDVTNVISIPKCSFTMPQNLTLIANFVSNQFNAATGRYDGLFCQTNEVTPQSAGFFTSKVTARSTKPGTFSGKLSLAGQTASFSGSFDVAGNAALPLSFKFCAATLRLHLATDGSDTISGTVSNNDGSWLSPLEGNRAVFSASHPAAGFAGQYTLAVPGSTDDATEAPGGDGYGTVKVAANGNITVAGTLADGTTLSQSVPVSKQGDWPFYSAAAGRIGTNAAAIIGWLSFSNGLDGTVSWIKSPVNGDKYYPDGFTNETDILGSSYTPPTTNRAVGLNNGNGVVLLEEGNLGQSVSNGVYLSPDNKFTTTNSSLTLKVIPTTGLLKGTLKDTRTGVTTSPAGVVLQDENVGRGYFKGTNQTGALRLQGN